MSHPHAAAFRADPWLGDVTIAIIDPGTPNSTTYYMRTRPIAMTNSAKSFVAYSWQTPSVTSK